MLALPSILDLPEDLLDLQNVTFVRPSADNGLVTLLHQEDSDESLAGQVMVSRRLDLEKDTAVPVHVHQNTEKMYIGCYVLGAGIRIVVWKEGKPQIYRLDALSDQVIIPRGCPHAVLNKRGEGTRCLVITTPPPPLNAKPDIDWEPAIETLLRNEHLKQPA